MTGRPGQLGERLNAIQTKPGLGLSPSFGRPWAGAGNDATHEEAVPWKCRTRAGSHPAASADRPCCSHQRSGACRETVRLHAQHEGACRRRSGRAADASVSARRAPCCAVGEPLGGRGRAALRSRFSFGEVKRLHVMKDRGDGLLLEDRDVVGVDVVAAEVDLCPIGPPLSFEAVRDSLPGLLRVEVQDKDRRLGSAVASNSQRCRGNPVRVRPSSGAPSPLKITPAMIRYKDNSAVDG